VPVLKQNRHAKISTLATLRLLAIKKETEPPPGQELMGCLRGQEGGNILSGRGPVIYTIS